jgi:surface polysaccharide O-acyltransferase-like enzyme
MRIQSIDTFKGLAILAVVVIHTEPFLAVQAIKANWYYLGHSIQQISSFAIPYFFITAGYFFSKGIDKTGIFKRWWQYTSRLSALLLIWIVIDGILWGEWLEQIIRAKSLSLLFWNFRAIPSFALKRPELFFLRGTAVPLWFLVSLIVAVSLLAICLKLSMRPTALLVIGCSAYAISLITSFYSGTSLGIGLNLPLEQRGPLIAFSFLTVGHFFAVRSISIRFTAPLVVATLLMVFVESSLLSHFAGVPFQERPYLFSTALLASSVFLFAIQNPDFGTSSMFSKIGNRSLGIYLVHTPVLGAVGTLRGIVVHPLWEVFFPVMVLALSYALVILLIRIPYVRVSVL